MRLATVLLVCPILACANGSETTDLEVDGPDSASVNDQTPDDSGSGRYTSYDTGPSSGEDGGGGNDASSVHDAAHPVDSSVHDSSHPVDSSPPVDSSQPDTSISTGSDDCVGTVSAYLGISYTSACDDYYWNTLGGGNPCTVGGNECSAMSGGGVTYCCFKPHSGSHCYSDYSGTPQCVPQ
jgi:hypothetical protein